MISLSRLSMIAGALAALALIGCGRGSLASSVEDGGAQDGGSRAVCGDRPGLPAGVAIDDAGRSFTVRCEGVTLSLSFFEAGVLRLQYQPETPAPASLAVVATADPGLLPLTGSTADGFEICTSELRARVESRGCRVRVAQVDGTVLSEDPPQGGFFRTSASPGPGAASQEVIGVVRNAAPDERFFGLGLRTGTSLDRRGRVMEFWNTDAYDPEARGFRPDADPLYESIPFFVGLRGSTAYGSFLDNTWRLRLDMAASDPTTYRLMAFGGPVVQYLIAGPSMREVLRRYTWLTGRMPLPPKWSLGFQQSRWEGPCDAPSPEQLFCDQAGLRAAAHELRARRIPADGLWLDIQHMDGFRSFTWGSGFPDPAGLIAELDMLGFATTVIVDPAIKIDPAWNVYREALSSGYFLADAAGKPFEGSVWAGPSMFPDFGSPNVRGWWGGLVGRETDLGVRGLWIDMNEPSNFVDQTVSSALTASADGRRTTMAELHNVYGFNEARATYDGMRRASPGRRPFILSRAAFAGQQRYSAVWTGDAPSTWATAQMTLPMLLGLGLSGMAFAGSDVGGYSGHSESTPELYSRWMAVGSISPFFRAHAERNARRQEPWAFGPEVERASRGLIRARYELLPYLYGLFREAAQTGAPVLRPLVFEFQGDKATHAVSDEAMLGPSLLYAPVLESGASVRRIYLPPGRWYELHSGAAYDGGRSIAVDSSPHPLPFDAFPVYVREGAIIPRIDAMEWTGEKAWDPLYLEVYPGPQESSFTLYEDDGQSLDHESGGYSAITYTLRRTPSGARLTAGPRDGRLAPPARRLMVRMRRVDFDVGMVTLSGEELPRLSEAELQAGGRGFYYDREDRSLRVAFPDRADFRLEATFDTALGDASLVRVPVRVRVPAGTPPGSTIHIATSAGGWKHQPLSLNGSFATGTVEVPRGDWFFYKFTRGDWGSVEKTEGCSDRPDRAALAAALPGVDDEVDTWADVCAR